MQTSRDGTAARAHLCLPPTRFPALPIGTTFGCPATRPPGPEARARPATARPARTRCSSPIVDLHLGDGSGRDVATAEQGARDDEKHDRIGGDQQARLAL